GSDCPRVSREPSNQQEQPTNGNVAGSSGPRKGAHVVCGNRHAVHLRCKLWRRDRNYSRDRDRDTNHNQNRKGNRFICAHYCSLLPKPTDRLAGEINPNTFYLRVEFKRMLAHLAAITRLLVATERRRGVHHVVG